ncbi:transposase [Halomonas sp. CKK8]|uniref:transposase n=1 Tax=Halomonas sp. CKK8 TaxID=3036127 RepID=UPI00241553D2|nr:transposase [Halomonas sp. CKK8]WFM69817.1 transposase [Halomonas sp. CKK8]
MTRRARLLLPATPLHLIQRGNNRSVCFADSDDCLAYLTLLEEVSRACGVAIHAYVLMTNHVHLLATPAGDPQAISAMMKRIGQVYVQRFNRRYRRTGTLFEGRFRSCLVGEARYLLACHAYIELNPVRAGMVTHPGEYRWSSYAANAQGSPDPIITPHAVIRELGRSHTERQQGYRELFREHLAEGLVDEIRQVTHSGLVLGTPRFQQQVAELLGRRTVRSTPGRKPRPPPEDVE